MLKFSRRHPWTLIGAAITSVILLAVVSVAFYFVTRAQQKTTTALQQKAAALQQEAAALDKAEQSLDVAREAVDDLYIDLASSWLADTSTFSEVQRKFLKRAADFYKQLAAETEGDASQLPTTATAHARIGEIHYYLHRYRQAAAALEQSIELTQKVVEQPDSTSDELLELIARYRQLHDTQLQLGKADDASQTLAEGWQYVQVLGDDVGDDVERANELSAWYVMQAEQAIRDDNPNLAEVHARKAKELIEKIRRDTPDDFAVELAFLESQRALSKALQVQGRLDEARKECEHALFGANAFRAVPQDSLPAQQLQIELFEQLASIETDQQQHELAVEHLRQNLALRRESLGGDKSPKSILMDFFYTAMTGTGEWQGGYDPDAYCAYSVAQVKLAQSLMAIGRNYDAECQFGEALLTMTFVANFPPSSVTRYKVTLASTYAVASVHCQNWLPQDAPKLLDTALYACHAALAESADAAVFRTGIFGRQADLAWFRNQFGYADELPPAKEGEHHGYIGPADVQFTFIEGRARSLASFNAREYEDCIRMFTKHIQERGKDPAYEWLYLAMSHALLGQLDEANAWYDKSVAEIEESDQPQAEMLELRDRAKSVLDQVSQTGPPERIDYPWRK